MNNSTSKKNNSTQVFLIDREKNISGRFFSIFTLPNI